jgi:hypothetical protein
MKRAILIAAIVLVAVAANAQQVTVGDKSLDKYLTGVAADYAAGKIAKEVFQDELKFNFGMSYKDFNMLINKGYNAGDAYLLGMLHKQSGKSITSLIKKRKPGQGWGELAHQLGIPPSELNKMRVAMKKEWKEEEKAQKKEHKQKEKAKDEGQKAKGKGKNK